MAIRNLTPHELVFYAADGIVVVAKIPSEGVARAKVDLTRTGDVELLTQAHIKAVYGLGHQFGGSDGEDIPAVPLVRPEYGEPVGLPEPAEDVDLIVSLVTAQAARAAGRTTGDLLLLQELVRDDGGRVIGARSLSRL